MGRPERSIVIIGGVILALVVVALVAVLTIGSAEPQEFPPGSPQATFQEYLQALEDRDADRAYSYLSQAAQQETPFDRFSENVRHRSSYGEETRIRIDRVEQQGDEAELYLTIEHFSGSGLEFNRYASTREVHMVRENGAWKIDESFLYLGALDRGADGLAVVER